ncbi:MAG: ATPase, T2SS/T4P/T4SS family [Pseudomonadota bacterium]
MNTSPNAQVPPAGIVNWPLPPYFSVVDDLAGSDPCSCVVQLRTGIKLHGMLISFSSQEPELLFQALPSEPIKTIPLNRLRSLWLEQPVSLIPAPVALEGRASEVFAPSERQHYKVEFEDQQIMTGETMGYVSSANGLFLYLPEPDGRVVRWFIPVSASKKQEIGRRLGEVLIEKELASPATIDAALARQQELRTQRIGDVLTANHIVSRDQLERAIIHQKSMPVLKLGEALIQLGLVTQTQLETALERQHQSRKTPLGRILVEMGAVDSTTLSEALSVRLGIPFVSLQKFNFDAAALRLVDAAFARKNVLIALCLHSTGLVVAFENPLASAVLDELQFITGRRIIPAVASREEILAAITEQYSAFGHRAPVVMSKDGLGDEYEYHKSADIAVDTLAARLVMDDTPLSLAPVEVPESDSTLVQLVNKTILDAHASGVSDIHIECVPGKQNTRIRFRKDGTLAPYLEIPASYRNALVSRIKIMAQLDITNHRISQDGKIDFKQFGPANVELRVVTIPTNNGLEDVVMRVLAASKPVPLTELGVAPDKLLSLQKLAQNPYGLILVCGPTGSGKTTTLHSLLSHINTPDRKIWTVEDPVEITQTGLRQVQVNTAIGWTFASAIRSFLRADPDVIMVGEMRDEETAGIGIEASLTGHLVLSTLHTNGAVESAIRLLDMGMDPFNFADALLGILAQRLAKGLCKHCKQSYEPADDEIRLLAVEYCEGSSLEPDSIIKQWRNDVAETGGLTLYQAKGCKHCNQSGYAKRIGLHELLLVTPAFKRLIQTRAPLRDLQVQARADGMRTLKQEGIAKVLQGLTDIAQVRAVCT